MNEVRLDRRQQGLEIIRYDRVVIRKPNDIRYFFTIKIDPMHPKTIINITLSGMRQSVPLLTSSAQKKSVPRGLFAPSL